MDFRSLARTFVVRKAALWFPAAALALTLTSSEAADVSHGEAAFVRQCALCHTIEKDGANRFGPNLFGIIGRRAGTVPGFRYSAAFRQTAVWDWNADTIAGFIAAPRQMMPQSPMAVFQGVSDRDRDDIVAFLATRK